MIIPYSIFNTVWQYRNKVGIVSVDDKRRLTYKEFKERINRVCALSSLKDARGTTRSRHCIRTVIFFASPFGYYFRQRKQSLLSTDV